MNKTYTLKDKKITIYLIIIGVLFQCLLFLGRVHLNSLLYAYYWNSIFIVLHLVSIFILMVILTKSRIIIWYNLDYIKVIRIFSKKMKYSDITNIWVDNNLNLLLGNNNNVIKIKLIDVERNRLQYLDLLNEIKNKSELAIDVNKLYNTIISQYKNQCSNKYVGLLKYIYVYLAIDFVINTMVLITLFFTNILVFDHINIVRVFILVKAVLSGLVLYLMSKRHPYMKVIILWFAIFSFIGNLAISIILSVPHSIARFDLFDMFLYVDWLLIIILAFLAVRRYLKISDNVKYAFNRLNTNKAKESFICLCVFFIITIVAFYAIGNNPDKLQENEKKYYNTIDELINAEYEEDEILYLVEGNYYYIIRNLGTSDYEELVYKNDDNKFTFCDGSGEDAKDFNKYFDIIDLAGFNAYLTITVHNDECIIMINRHNMRWARSNVLVYDNYGELNPNKTFNDICYFKVMDSLQLNEEYKIKLLIGKEENVIFDYKDFK